MKRDRTHLKKYFLLFLIAHLTACSIFQYDTPLATAPSQMNMKKHAIKKIPLQKSTANTPTAVSHDNIPVVNLMG